MMFGRQLEWLSPVLFAFALSASAQDYVVEGDKASPVRVIAYEDLQCPDCAVYRKMLDEKLLPKYGGSVAFEHRDYPLRKHQWARQASVAARYFGSLKPELGIAFRRFCADHLKEITAENFTDKLRDFAKANRTDPDKAVAALNDATLAKVVEEEFQEGVARGVARTPTVFVNGEPFIETFTFEDISKSIDAALAAAKKPK
jgi:protein-disulfide isomerase